MKKLLPLVLLALISFTAHAQEINTVVLFESNGTDVKTSSHEKLDLLIQNTPPGERIKFEIMGVASKNLNAQEHTELALNRANSLVDVMASKGIAEGNFNIQSQSIFQPTVCREAYTVYSVEMIMPGSILEPVIAQYDKDRVLDLRDYKPKATQTFAVDPLKNIIVKGEDGTVLTFQAYSFVYPNGTPVLGEVEIQLEEFYSTADLLVHDLTTMADGELLESGGTIFVEATCQGQKIEMANGVEFIMEFPTPEGQKEGMQTFMGSRNGDGSMNWTLPQAPQIVGALDNIYANESQGVFNQITANNDLIDNNNQWNVRSYYPPNGEYGGIYGLDTAAMSAEELSAYKENVAFNQNTNKIDGYMLSSSKLGWINCDRFYDVDPALKSNLLVSVEGEDKVAVRLVFSDIKCVMNGSAINESAQFASIPVGQKATVVAYYMKDDQPFFAMKEVTITKDGSVSITPEAATERDLKDALASLDS